MGELRQRSREHSWNTPARQPATLAGAETAGTRMHTTRASTRGRIGRCPGACYGVGAAVAGGWIFSCPPEQQAALSRAVSGPVWRPPPDHAPPQYNRLARARRWRQAIAFGVGGAASCNMFLSFPSHFLLRASQERRAVLSKLTPGSDDHINLLSALVEQEGASCSTPAVLAPQLRIGNAASSEFCACSVTAFPPSRRLPCGPHDHGGRA